MTARNDGRQFFVIKCVVVLMFVLTLGGGPWVESAAASSTDLPIAFVNGEPITKEAVVDLLMKAHGLSALQQLVLLELAKQEANRLGLKVTPADVDQEYQTSIDRIVPREEEGKKLSLTDEDRRKAMNKLLEEKGVSFAEFMLGMERNAYLRKIVEKDLVIDRKSLQAAFIRMYGWKIQVRHIEINATESAKVNAVLDRLKKGDDFAVVAREMSQNEATAAIGGELEPFTFNDEEIPLAFRTAAWRLEPGEYSQPVRVEEVFQIIKLVRRIPNEKVRFEDVKDEVDKKLREELVPKRMSAVANELFKKSKVQVIDHSLREEFKELVKRNEAVEASAD